ncbi:MAG TPA: hypothetical protein VD766_04565 [Solirubrobacterales bacterium]|nr:hypothetical protein [Solirubrobacterales bacterium]
MKDLRLYRVAFAPALAALVVLAFSLGSAPEPVEPPGGTLEFDPSAAMKSARDVLALGDSREAGSETDDAAADLVAERFGAIVSGTVTEQVVEAEIEGSEAELRNVILTLPGASDRAILLVAGRDSREGAGAPSSAAATGMLLALADELAVAQRQRTLILASTSGASAEAEGARELISALPDRTTVDAVIVISQPGFDEPFGPHVVTSAGGHGPPVGLARTAEEVLQDRAGLSAGTTGALAQIARYAVPAAAGEQAALIDEGQQAVALSSAGELPVPPEDSASDRLSSETVDVFGQTLLALVAALDAATDAPASGQGSFLWVGENLVPGWSVAVIVLALLLPPLALSASLLARAHRGGDRLGQTFGWAAEWWLPAAVVCAGLYGLALAGVIPGSDVPYDPARYELGVGEAAMLVLLVALAIWLWWVIGLRRMPPNQRPRALGAASGLLAVVACVLVWIANAYLALVLLPLAHLVAVLGTSGRRPAALAVPLLVLGTVPLAAATIYVASALDWGSSTPWQLAVLVGGGGFQVLQVVGGFLFVASVAGVLTAALATARASSREELRVAPSDRA